MEGFNENDSIPSFNSSELIEEVESDDNEEDEDEVEDEDDEEIEDEVEDEDYDGSSDGTHMAAKRLKMIADENSFKFDVMKVLKRSCKVAGDYAVSGKLVRTPLVAISLKVLLL